MDDRRFDEIVRTWGGGTSRRQVLWALGASVAGTLLLPFRVIGAATQNVGAVTCVQDSDCADADGNACTGGRCDNGTCAFFIVDCVSGYICCGNGECCPETGQCQSDADCADADGDPCTGATCENGTCVVSSVLCVPGFVCCGGGCVEACAENESLDATCQCVGTGQNSGDIGTSVAGDGSDGGGDGSTTESVDDTTQGGSVSTTSGSVADAGVITLPNTGSGDPVSAQRSRWWTPAALIGAGAALARLRRAQE